MKKTTKKSLTALLCAIILASSLSSCAQNESDITDTDKQTSSQGTSVNTPTQSESVTQSPSSSDNGNSSSVYNDITKDSYEEQIKYYMELTESLQAELLKLKEETYIEECEYQLKISTLEQTVQNLKNTISTSNKNDNKLPTSGTVTPTPDKIVAKSDFKYTTDDGKITITGYVGTEIDVEIPSNIDGFPVISIGEGAFKNILIRSVVIPSSVQSIDWFAFSGCSCLEKITLPSSVISIGYGAFDLCPKTLEVICPKDSYAEAYALSWGMKVTAE